MNYKTFLWFLFVALASAWTCPDTASNCGVSGPTSINLPQGTTRTFLVSSLCAVTDHNVSIVSTDASLIVSTSFPQDQDSLITISGGNSGDTATVNLKWCDGGVGTISQSIVINVVAPTSGAPCDTDACSHGECQEDGSCIEFASIGDRCSPSQHVDVNGARCEDDAICVGKSVSDVFGFCRAIPEKCDEKACFCSETNTGLTVCVAAAAEGESCKTSLGPFIANANCEDQLTCVPPVNPTPGASGTCKSCPMFKCRDPNCPSNYTIGMNRMNDTNCPTCPCCADPSGECVEINVCPADEPTMHDNCSLTDFTSCQYNYFCCPNDPTNCMNTHHYSCFDGRWALAIADPACIIGGGGVICTDDVQDCPDGSTVSRDTFNDCAFHPCPTGCGNSTEVACLIDGCHEKTCEAEPDAVCVSNNCGGCNWNFYNARNELVVCDLAPAVCATVLCLTGSICREVDGQPVCECIDVCTEESDPRCGTDGTTYGNACEMARATCQSQGEIVQDYEGECAPVPVECQTVKCSWGSRCQVTDGNVGCVCLEMCPMIYRPVCGSDGQTYGNDCQLAAKHCTTQGAVTQDHEGECEVLCTDDIQDCPDGSTVSRDTTNDCAFAPCPSGCADSATEVQCLVDGCFNKTCDAYPDAVCVSNNCAGCNWNWYNGRNELVDCAQISAACATVLCITGSECREVNGQAVCECIQSCTKEYNPRCGSDGNTYGNPCMMNKAICESQGALSEAYEGECVSVPVECQTVRCGWGSTCQLVDGAASCVCNELCAMVYDPVCGSDGHTYGNECELSTKYCKTQGQVTQDHSGECEPMVCTDDVQDCPDGSTVSRDSNNGCAFQLCPSGCPPNVTEVNCLVDGCFHKTCDAHPDAHCISNYCGGCNWDFYNDKNERVKDCEITSCTTDTQTCPDGSSVVRDPTRHCAFDPCPTTCAPGTSVNCLIDSCLNKTCEAQPDAICVSNTCGGCNFDFYNDRNERINCSDVTDMCLTDVHECSDGSFVSRNARLNCHFNPCPVVCDANVTQVQCLVDGCFNKRCDAYPKAVCFSNNCGGCNYNFYDENLNVVDCNGVVCLADVRECEDGTFVSRDPKNQCRFKPCPGTGTCVDSDCIHGRCDSTGNHCVTLSLFNETCNPSLGPDVNGANCADPYVCDRPSKLLGATGHCIFDKGMACGDSECTCYAQKNGTGSCVRAAKYLEQCNPSLGPFVANASCASHLTCVTPPMPGAHGVCQLDNDACKDGSCICAVRNVGLVTCSLLSKEGDTCNPSLGPFVDNANCQANLMCIRSGTLLGASGVCKAVRMCPMDIRQCPDGSWVSRNASRLCQFDACSSSVVCTMDAKICPDGSSVGRDGSRNCEWFPCPTDVVCPADVFDCGNGLFVNRDPENNCSWQACPVETDCINGHSITLAGGVTGCVKEALLDQPCNPSLGPKINYSTCLAPLVCNSKNTQKLGASGVCQLPTECDGGNCSCSVTKEGIATCVRSVQAGETCQTTLGMPALDAMPALDNSNCANGLVCKVNTTDSTTGVCGTSGCAVTLCMTGTKCVTEGGVAKCVGVLGGQCNPSVPNNACEAPLTCSRPSNAAPGAPGVCALPTVCGNSTCSCANDAKGQLHCSRVAKLGESCYPSIGPYYDNSMCQAGLICVPTTTAPGGAGVCRTISRDVPSIMCSATGKQNLCKNTAPGSVTLTSDQKTQTFSVDFSCDLQTIVASYVSSSKGLTVTNTFAKKSLVPTFTITASDQVFSTGATGSITIEYCSKQNGGYASTSISIQVLSTNFTIEGAAVISSDTVFGSMSAVAGEETTSNGGGGLDQATKGWISAVVIVGTLLLIAAGYCIGKKCMGSKYHKQPAPAEIENNPSTEVLDVEDPNADSFSNQTPNTASTTATTIHEASSPR